MLTEGNTLTGGLHGSHIPVPTTARAIQPRPTPRGYAWTPATEPDPDALARLARLGIVTITPTVVDEKPVKVVRKTGRKIKMPISPGRTAIPLDTEGLAQDYRDGLSVRQLARKYKVSGQTIRARLRDADVQMRPNYHVPTVPIERILELHHQGLSQGEIGELVGLRSSSISYRLRAAGIFVGRSAPSFDVDEAVRLYRKGWSTYELAQRYGVGRKNISTHLRSRGETLRNGGSRGRVDTARVRQLADEGHTQEQIAQRMGISDRTVRDYLKAGE